MSNGTVSAIWRYPVKSMGGEEIRETPVSPDGIAGDRGWALRDEKRGGITSAKRLAALMRCAARYEGLPEAGQLNHAEITLPDGERLSTRDAGISRRISETLGMPLTLWPRLPEDAAEHYRRALPDGDFLEELRQTFGLEADEPFPDLSRLPPSLMEYETPPGTYFDAFPLLLVTGASLRRLTELLPESRVDVRRFRPNLVLDDETNAVGFLENDWVEGEVEIGEVRMRIDSACPRCVMVTNAYAEVPKDAAILRAIVRENAQNFGVYATPLNAGVIRVGDGYRVLPR